MGMEAVGFGDYVSEFHLWQRYMVSSSYFGAMFFSFQKRKTETRVDAYGMIWRILRVHIQINVVMNWSKVAQSRDGAKSAL